MAEYIKNSPTADVLMTSMRSMGYTFEAAVADIIDNSLSANCHRVEIKFPIDPQFCYVAICDDGCGMDRNELVEAMKYGSKNAQFERTDTDLGRFGLGLKAASLSQCRKLTVISKKNNVKSALQWNLDLVEKTRDWDVIEFSNLEVEKLLFNEYLDAFETGTVVLWEEFDFFEKNAGSVYAELSKFQGIVEKNISLIFHRFINRDKPNNIEFYINHFQIVGLDPFLEKHKKTNIRRKVTIPINDTSGIERMVIVQPYILPFQKDMSNDDKKMVGGIEDYRTKQGFYIYRNERLIIWGTWFGRPRGELTKHARIRVDIPNTLDDIWCIDIKKQAATIPNIIKNQLKKAVDEAMDIAIKAQTYRGRVENVSSDVDFIWNRIKDRDDSFRYVINRDSAIFELIKSNLSDDLWSRLDMVLDEVENAIPFQQIYIDKSQNKVVDINILERNADIEAKATILLKIALSMGEVDRDTAIENIFKAEPFSKYSELKMRMKEDV